MLGKLITTHMGNMAANALATAVGIILAIMIDSPRTGTIVFLSVTAVESGIFSLIYGIRGDWREEPAARAVFWFVLAYFAVAFELVIGFLFPYRFSWFAGVREMLYLALSIAGLNLVLILTRILGIRMNDGSGTQNP